MDIDFGRFTQRDRSIHPLALMPNYKTCVLRSPRIPLWSLRNSLAETTGLSFRGEELGRLDHDLTLNYAKDGEPIGEHINVYGRVLDEHGHSVPNTRVEVWQANAGGRYRHVNDPYVAPIDPNFGGCGRTLTDEQGNCFFRTVKPGAYPFRNFVNAWRPVHTHFSVFGSGFAQRLITHMYLGGVFVPTSSPTSYRTRRRFSPASHRWTQRRFPARLLGLPLRHRPAGSPLDVIREKAGGKLSHDAPYRSRAPAWSTS